MKLEVGMYVRTKEGKIDKIFQYNEQENNPLCCTLNCYVTFKGSILKASHNIIDLIEVGDYVNGHFVINAFWNINGNYVVLIEDDGCEGSCALKNNEIKSVLTKEQFESMSYKVN